MGISRNGARRGIGDRGTRGPGLFFKNRCENINLTIGRGRGEDQQTTCNLNVARRRITEKVGKEGGMTRPRGKVSPPGGGATVGMSMGKGKSRFTKGYSTLDQGEFQF